jgi:hypothetical protein
MKLVPTFMNRGCHVVSEKDPHGFLNRSHYCLEISPQLSSRGWVDPVPDPQLVRKSGSAGNRTRDLWPLDHRGHIWVKRKLIFSKETIQAGTEHVNPSDDGPNSYSEVLGLNLGLNTDYYYSNCRRFFSRLLETNACIAPWASVATASIHSLSN